MQENKNRSMEWRLSAELAKENKKLKIMLAMSAVLWAATLIGLCVWLW
jgi:hypothetical protein